jgi:hypothetical protein
MLRPAGGGSDRLGALSDAELNDRAMNELHTEAELARGLFQLDACRWNVDQATGIIDFTRDGPRGAIQARAPVQILASFNTKDGAWLWSWANPSIRSSLTAHATTTRDFGEQRGIAELTGRTFECTEADCWRITALACMINGAHDAYRGPAGPTLVFMA